MERSNRISAVLVLAVAMLAVPACSDSNDATDLPVAAAVEDGLNDVLQNTIDPLLRLVSLVQELANPVVLAPQGDCGVDTSGICGTGSVDCDLVGNVAQLHFDNCLVVDDEGLLTIDGNMDLTLGEGVVDLVLDGLTINESEKMDGTAVLTPEACSVDVDIAAGNDAAFEGTLIQCAEDEWPTAESTLLVTIDSDAGTFLIDVEFNGTSDVTGDASLDGDKVAECDIDLEALEASCDEA